MTEYRLRTSRPVNLYTQLSTLHRGSGDPTWHSDPGGGIWRTTYTPVGPGLERLGISASTGEVVAQVFGPGTDWLIERLPWLLGEHDDPSGFVPPPVLAPVARAHPGLRIGRTERVMEALIPAILEQKVTGKEAWLGWRTLVRKYGEPAPSGCPRKLWVCPPPEVWKQIPSWDWHRASVDSSRSRAIVLACAQAERFEALVGADPVAAQSALREVDGIGIWTAAETAQRALGDPDAVSYRDYHVAKELVYAFTGDRNGTDEQMAALLLPYAGHRYRVQRLLELGGPWRPRHGPRMTIPDMRDF